MQYTSEDKDENGLPMPRGEIWLRGPGVFLGYYKDAEKTKEAITEDGWLKSGDVGAIMPKNKGLKIIDRKKNIFKLSQGEYVAAEKVENFYQNCDLISEIFLHGESSQNFAIVFITPNKSKLEAKAQSLGIKGTFEELCANPQLKLEVLKQMNDVGKQKGLKSF
jgi:long-chain acyl-CoA synthetase